MSTDLVLHPTAARRPLTRVNRQRVVRQFAEQRVRVTATSDEQRTTVHISAERRRLLWGTGPVTAEQRDAVLGAFADVTDARLTWHHREAS